MSRSKLLDALVAAYDLGKSTTDAKNERRQLNDIIRQFDGPDVDGSPLTDEEYANFTEQS